jgi:hypothetical protein
MSGSGQTRRFTHPLTLPIFSQQQTSRIRATTSEKCQGQTLASSLCTLTADAKLFGSGRDQMKQINRRTMLGAAASIAATPAFAEGCQVGPPPHHKGPLVFMDYDQLELDASYDQVYYEPLVADVSKRLSSNSDAMRARIGAPQRVAYGPTEIEKLDIYRTSSPKACG